MAAVTSGYMAWRLTRAIVLVSALFIGVGALMLAVVWGGAFLLNALELDRWLAGLGIGKTVIVGVLNIVAILLLLIMITAALLTMAERKWSARMQNRLGPNRARLFKFMGPFFGIPHLIADTLKMLFKEDFVPPQGAAFLFNLAPVLAFVPAFALMAVVPIGPDFTAFGIDVHFQIARLDIGMLYVFAIASIAVFGTTLAGWASNNKFALLGALRASAQMISYEVTLGLTLVGAFMLFGTLRPETIVAWQEGTRWGVVPNWGVFYQPFALVFFFVAAAAEIKRAPFDLPESESEIIGYFLEYSGMKFGLFMVAEFAEVVVLAAIIVVVFFGGWHLPWVTGEELQAALTASSLGADWGSLLFALIGLSVFIAKMMFFVWLQMLIRWSLPRFRYDQVMDLGWKILLPLSLANVVVTGVVIVLDPALDLVLGVGLLELLVLAGVFVSANAPDRNEPTPAGVH